MLASPCPGENEGPPIVYAGKYYAVIRGQHIGVFKSRCK